MLGAMAGRTQLFLKNRFEVTGEPGNQKRRLKPKKNRLKRDGLVFFIQPSGKLTRYA
jgi:hypothetical protein